MKVEVRAGARRGVREKEGGGGGAKVVFVVDTSLDLGEGVDVLIGAAAVTAVSL